MVRMKITPEKVKNVDEINQNATDPINKYNRQNFLLLWKILLPKL